MLYLSSLNISGKKCTVTDTKDFSETCYKFRDIESLDVKVHGYNNGLYLVCKGYENFVFECTKESLDIYDASTEELIDTLKFDILDHDKDSVTGLAGIDVDELENDANSLLVSTYVEVVSGGNTDQPLRFKCVLYLRVNKSTGKIEKYMNRAIFEVKDKPKTSHGVMVCSDDVDDMLKARGVL